MIILPGVNLLQFLPNDSWPQVETPPEAFGVPHEVSPSEAKWDEVNQEGIHLRPTGVERTVLMGGFINLRAWQGD